MRVHPARAGIVYEGNTPRDIQAMSDLYANRASQSEIRKMTRAARDLTGNLEPSPAIFPNRMAPIVRTGVDGQRELLMARWGFPPPIAARP